MRPPRLSLLLGLSGLSVLTACAPEEGPAAHDPPDARTWPDAVPSVEASTIEAYRVRGEVAPAFAGDPLPPATSLAVTIFDAWELDGDPFATDAPVLATPVVAADHTFVADVEEERGGVIAGVLVDDTEGDLLVPSINDRRVDFGTELADVDAFVLSRARVDGWRASPALGGRDPEAEGAALVTFLDADRRPEAGARPIVLTGVAPPPVLVVFLDADGLAIVDGATATTSSGRALLLGARSLSVAGGDWSLENLDGELTHNLVGLGTRPGTLFLETVSRVTP